MIRYSEYPQLVACARWNDLANKWEAVICVPYSHPIWKGGFYATYNDAADAATNAALRKLYKVL